MFTDNGSADRVNTDLLAADVDREALIKYLPTTSLMFYIHAPAD